MWYSSWCLCLVWIIAVSSVCIAHAPFASRRLTRKRKMNRLRPRWPKPRFRRRKLHFHLVLRCRARKGNRPEHIFGKSRAELLVVRCNKRCRYRHGRSRRDALAFYEACVSGPPPKLFKLVEPDILLILPLIWRLGPGGIPFEMVEELVIDPDSPPDDPKALVCLQVRLH